MGNWHDQKLWQGLLDGSRCPVCVEGKPNEILSEGPSSWLTMPTLAPMQGYLCLVSKVHAVEFHHLSPIQANDFLSDVRSVSSALSEATKCIKINYEVHGNILPHLHMHFFPRFVNDPFEGKKIDVSQIPQPIYTENDYPLMAEKILTKLNWPS